MSFLPVPAGGGSPTDPFSLPNAVSIAVEDSGAGGLIFINGLGLTNPSTTYAVDLKTFFGAAAFHSYPLLNAFRALATASATAAQNQLVPALKLSIYPLYVGGVPAEMPGVDYTFSNGGNGLIAPLLSITGPNVAGFWRIEIALRHTITD